MKAKKVEKVVTTLKDRIGLPLKRHLTEILTRVNNLDCDLFFKMILFGYQILSLF